MHKRTRRALFWFAVIVFGAASWVAALIAQGYKYDFVHNAFVRTGGIAVTANTDATLFVDDRQAAPMSFLAHRTGVDRLLPGSYSIRVMREGYSSWRKTVDVQEGFLTDFPSVLVLPTDTDSQPAIVADIVTALKESRTIADATPTPTPSPRPKTPVVTPKQVTLGDFTLRDGTLYRTVDSQEVALARDVLGMGLTDNDHRILWFTRNEVWVLWVSATDYQPYHAADDRELVTRLSVPIVRAAWFPGRDHIVVDLGGGDYRVLEIDLRGGINVIKI